MMGIKVMWKFGYYGNSNVGVMGIKELLMLVLWVLR